MKVETEDSMAVRPACAKVFSFIGDFLGGIA